jgi:hypothetical protein
MNKWKESSAVLFISASFISLILVLQPNRTKVLEYRTRIPKTTTEHYLFNSSSLLKKIVFNELFIHEDESLLQNVKELLSKKSKSETSIVDLNIDYSAPIEIIRFKRNSKSFTAIKFKISNLENFAQISTKLRKVLLFRDQLNAYLVLGETKNNKSILKRLLLNNSFAYSIKNQETKHFFSSFRNSKLVSFWTICANDNQLKIEQKIADYQTHTSLEPKGFHLSTTINTNQLGVLKETKVSNLIHLNELKYISVNYLGLYFIDDSQIQAIPKFDLLLSYKNKISGDSVLIKVLNYYNWPFEAKSKECFQLGTQFIKMKQIDSNQFIISTLNNIRFSKTFLNPIIQGDPKNIVKIRNAGWKGLFLELMPGFKASKNFLETADKISTYNNKKGLQVICLSFKKNEDALHNLLKYTLNLQ